MRARIRMPMLLAWLKTRPKSAAGARQAAAETAFWPQIEESWLLQSVDIQGLTQK